MSADAGPADLLVFGPHPDDIEIGAGGSVAKHARLGHQVGLCDLTAGEMGSNGTVDERLAEAIGSRQYLDATREVLQTHGCLWFLDESYVVSRKRG